jgi:uncharacterized membrane protein
MLGKTRRAARGELSEESVVQTPRARLYGGVSNALLGVIYYLAAGVAIWLVRTRAEAAVLGAVIGLAAATSLFLAYSLLFVTRRPCAYCWTGHAVNWGIAALYGWMLGAGVLFSIT